MTGDIDFISLYM